MRLIDADALINDILTDYGCDPKYIADETIDGLKPYTDNLILERIGLQPTIDAVPVVHGEWDDLTDKWDLMMDRHMYVCSICKKNADYFIGGTEDWWTSRKPNYCPNCGAKMDGKEKDK